ncbi:MAG: sel1 repeat family protein [Sphingomonadales bacterium]|nr:MAG: sel1 repeat family protein [Sphingomonadales bacterium]
MRGWIALAGIVAGLMFSQAASAQKLPSRYDERRDSAMFNGKQNMPYQLWGVAIKWHRDCMKGTVAECVRLARAFEDGAGDMAPDMRVAIAYWLKACEMGVGSACARAATILRDGSATFTNPELAQKMADRGCSALKDQSSCAGLAQSLVSAPGGKSDPRAATLIDNACAAGDDEGCRMKANNLYWDKADPASRTQAVPLFERACQAKRAWGCLGLAEIYGQGAGVAKDRVRAAQYAATGCTQAQGDRLRLCTLHGISLARPGDKAALNKGEQFLDASCKGGDGMACNQLGRIGLSQVSGATTTAKEGLYYSRRGCDLSYGQACTYLAVAYSGGMGVKVDDAIALALHDKGCRLGDAEACAMAKGLLARDSGLRGRIPSIDPSLPVGEQLKRARAMVESGDRMTGVHAVYRLVSEANEEAEWLFGGWLYYGLDGVFDTSRKSDGLILFENAARVGHVDAAVYMGMAYWYGDGVPENRKKGEDYMAIAAMRGSQMAGAIFRSMKNEPIRQEFARRQKEMEEAALTRRSTWTSSWANYVPGSGLGFGNSYTPQSSSGRTVSSIIDNSNWNQRINYLSGSSSVCPRTNSYC